MSQINSYPNFVAPTSQVLRQPGAINDRRGGGGGTGAQHHGEKHAPHADEIPQDAAEIAPPGDSVASDEKPRLDLRA